MLNEVCQIPASLPGTIPQHGRRRGKHGNIFDSNNNTKMNFFNSLSGKKLTDCPRCLGKGQIDIDDIKRLKRELKWVPGKCAYCNGNGKVDSALPEKLPADFAYLTTNLTDDERKRVLKKDSGAMLRAEAFDNQTDAFIMQVEYLYFQCNLDYNKIADFFLLPRQASEVPFSERTEMIDYIRDIARLKYEKDS